MPLTTSRAVAAAALLVTLASASSYTLSGTPAAPQISVVADPGGLAAETIGYFKASNTGAGDQFGRVSVLSGDGRTLVVTAGLEQSGATGVNGNQADNSTPNAGAVYVFRRNGGSWVQEAYLKGDPTTENQFFGYGYPLGYRALSVSSDGSIVAVGASGEPGSAGPYVGAVYLYGRDPVGQWSLLQKISHPASLSNDYFGSSVDISGDGNTLRALGLGPRDSEGIAQGQHYLFVRTGGTWALQTTLEIPHQDVDFCSSGELSGDGATVVFFCQSYAAEGSRVITWKRSGNSWTQLPGFTPIHSFSTQEVALSHHANRLAFVDSSHELSSNVRVFRWGGTQWIEEAAIETPAGLGTGYGTWGAARAFDRNGSTLAIGDFASDALGAGVSGTIEPGGDNEGAVFLYQRNGGAWQFRKQIKAPNPGWGDGFGLSVSLSGSGRSLAVGAVWEDSAATGIGGDPLSDAAEESGAVYLYQPLH